MRSIYFSSVCLSVVFFFGFLIAIPSVQAEVFTPDECAAVLGACKRSFFGSDCSDNETAVARCNEGVKSCCKIVRNSDGDILTGDAALAEFQRDMSSGTYTTVLDQARARAADRTRSGASGSSSSGSGDTGSGASGSSSDSGGGSAATSGNTSLTNLNYTLLERIPGQEDAGGKLPDYIRALLNASLVIIVLSAVFMITVGGFLLLTSAGNTSKAKSAKDIITDAVLGLILALISYLILYVINPDLVTLRIDQFSTSAPIAAPQSVTGAAVPTTTSSGDTYTHAEAAAALSAKGIPVTSTGRCSDQNNKSCTSLEKIPKSTIANVIALKEKTGCAFNVTGGTETGHSAHGSGKPVVDLNESPCLEQVFRNQKSSLASQYNIKAICADRDSREAAHSCTYVEAVPHFHVQFSN